MRIARSGAALVACCLLLGVLSCSSAPKPVDEVDTVKNEAAELAQSGNAYFDQGNYPQAQRLFAMALDDDLSVYYVPGIVTSYDSLGKVYLAAGRNDQASIDFQRAYDLAEKLKDPELLAESVNDLGELLLKEGKPEEAKSRFLEALPQIKDDQSAIEARLLHNLGSADKALGSYPEALDNLGKALAIHTTLKAYAQCAADYYMIASVYAKQGELGQAKDEAALALSNDQKMENSPGIASDFLALGAIAERSSALSDAYDDYQASLEVYRSLGFVAEVKDLLGRLQRIASALGRTQDAAAYGAALKTLGAAQ